MKPDRSLILILLLFLVLSVVVSWSALLSDGNLVYRDEWTVLNIDAFKEYFFHIHKQYDPNLDYAKRIPELWIHFFMDYETYDKVKFTMLAFFTLVSSFYVSNKILKHEKIGRDKRLTISAFTAVTYLINPLNVQLFLSYYPTINYMLFPLFFYSLYRGISQYHLRSALVSSLIASFMFLMVVHSLLYLALSFLIVLVMLLRRPLKVVPLFRNTAIFLIVLASSTAFTVLPYLYLAFSSGPIEGYNVMTDEMLVSFSSVAYLPKAMLMDSHIFWWPYVDYVYPGGNIFFLVSFVFSAILLVHAVFDRNEWSVMALLGLLLFFFFSKGNAPPFSGVYEFLNFKLPLFGWLLRVPMKFAHVIPFFFSVLFLRCSLSAAKRNKALFYAFSIGYLTFLFIFSWPFFTGDMAGYLMKANFESKIAELGEINSIISDDDPAVLAYGIWWWDGLWDLNANILPNRVFIDREMRAYIEYGNWSGLQIAPHLGAQYLLMPGEYEKDAGQYFEQLLKGPQYSLFRTKEDPSIATIPSASHLCYCHMDTARSLIRDPTATGLLELLVFPYQDTDFPQEHVDAADYLILDSVPLGFTSVESGDTFSYFSQTFGSLPAKTWSRVFSFESRQSKTFSRGFSYQKKRKSENSVWGREYGLGKGFAITEADPFLVSVKGYEDILTLSDLELTTNDRFTVKDGDASFTIQPRAGPYYSIVRSGLDLQGGSYYEVSLSVDSESVETFNAEIILQDYYGGIQTIPLMNSSGSFTKEEKARFTIPYTVNRATLLFSLKTPEENASRYEVNSFELRRLITEKRGEKISSSFHIAEEEEYDVYLRLLKSRDSGELELYLDGEPLGTLVTNNNVSHLYWEKVYSGMLPAGRHELTLEQTGGFNAVNVGYVRKSGTDDADLSNKTLIYRLTGKNDFFSTEAWVIRGSTSSTFYYLESEAPVSAVIEVLSSGVYDITYAISGSAEIWVDGSKVDDRVHLEKGRHVIEVRPAGNIHLDHVTLMKQGSPRKHDAAIVNYTRLDPSTYSVWVNSTTPFFLSFGRGYDPHWTASVDGTLYRPVSSYGNINSYYIEETGLNHITIEYLPQKVFYAGIILGIVGLSLAVVYVARSES